MVSKDTKAREGARVPCTSEANTTQVHPVLPGLNPEKTERGATSHLPQGTCRLRQKTGRCSAPRHKHKGRQTLNLEQYRVGMAWNVGRSSTQPARVLESWEVFEGERERKLLSKERTPWNTL